MTATETPQEAATETVGMGIRLTVEQREAVEGIARKQCNTVGGIIRLAVQQLIENEEQAKAALTLTQRNRQAA